MFDLGERGVMRQSPLYPRSHDAPAGGALESLFFFSCFLSAPVVVPLISTHSPNSPLPYIVHPAAHPSCPTYSTFGECRTRYPPNEANPLEKRERERATRTSKPKKRKENREEEEEGHRPCADHLHIIRGQATPATTGGSGLWPRDTTTTTTAQTKEGRRSRRLRKQERTKT